MAEKGRSKFFYFEIGSLDFPRRNLINGWGGFIKGGGFSHLI